jgi:di/tricarboxylate transporter
MIAALVAAATGLVPIAEAMMLGALTMVLTGCLTMDEAYRSIEWRAIFLVAGMLPAGIALTSSGAAEWLGELMVATLMGWGPMALVAGMLLLAALVTQVISGQVAAVVLTPIGVAAAQQVGANPYSLAMAVAIGCSLVYATPVGHPTNVYVMGPGGYSFKDYVRVGLPLTVVLILAALVLLPVLWPL